MKHDREQRMIRERLLFQYTSALERGDFENVARILQEAENDSELERMLLEINDSLAGELPATQSVSPHTQNGRVIHMMAATPARPTYLPGVQKPTRGARRWRISPTLVAALVLTLMVSAVLVIAQLPNSNGNPVTPAFAGQPETNTSSAATQNLDVFSRYVNDVWNGGDIQVMNGLLTDDHILHITGMTETIFGKDALAGIITDWHNASPGGQNFSIAQIISNDSEVWARLNYGGSQVLMVVRLANGKIAETWGPDVLMSIFAISSVSGSAPLPQIQVVQPTVMPPTATPIPTATSTFTPTIPFTPTFIPTVAPGS